MIDAHTAAITDEYSLDFQPGAVAAGGGSVWVAESEGRDRVPNPPEGQRGTDHRRRAQPGRAGLRRRLAVGGRRRRRRARPGRSGRRTAPCREFRSATGCAAWPSVTEPSGRRRRSTARSCGSTWPRGASSKRIPVGGHPVAVAIGDGSVWVVGEDSKLLVRIDPRSNQLLDGIAVGGGPDAVVDGLGAVWVANRADGTVSRIDPATDRVTDTAPAGRLPVALAIADGALWVADADGAVLRIDPRRRAVAAESQTGSSPAGLAAVGGDVWATALAPPAAHRGGTLRLGWGPIADLDPGWAGYDGFSGGIIDLAYDGLLGYRRESGVAGTRLVGEPGRPACRSLPTAVAATPSGCARAFASPTARPSARATSAPRWSACWPCRTQLASCALRRHRRGGALPAARRSDATCRAGSSPTTGRARSPCTCAGPTRTCSRTSPAGSPRSSRRGPAGAVAAPSDPRNRPLSRRADRARTPHPVAQPILPPARRASGRIRRPHRGDGGTRRRG